MLHDERLWRAVSGHLHRALRAGGGRCGHSERHGVALAVQQLALRYGKTDGALRLIEAASTEIRH